MRIGLFGGSFNPVHIGHLRAAEEIRGLCSLEKVIFIPTHIAPHKPVRTLASPQHRLTMLELAIQDNRHFLVSDAELKRPGRSYSVETLRYFRAAFPEADPFFIMGMDAFAEIDTWKNYRDLFPLCNFVVMTRPGYSRAAHRADYSPDDGGGVFFFPGREALSACLRILCFHCRHTGTCHFSPGNQKARGSRSFLHLFGAESGGRVYTAA